MCVRNKINIDIRRWEQIQINLEGGEKEKGLIIKMCILLVYS